MPVGPPSAEYMEQVVASMRETLRARSATAPDPVNEDASLSLFGEIPLVWAGEAYTVGKIGYTAALTLQKRMMRFRRFTEGPPADEAAIDAHISLVQEIVDQFWGFLDEKTRPATNPFLDLAPLEVGAIAGFFFVCQRI